MLLSCPNCLTAYDVPDAALAGRSRRLRCDHCGTQWKLPAPASQQAPAAPPEAAGLADADILREAPPEVEETDGVVAAEPVSVEAVEVHEMPEPAAPEPGAPPPGRISMLNPIRIVQAPAPPEPSPRRGLKISMVIALLIIVVILLAHRSISHFWPPSLRLFDALGLR